jgi:hypothetical protein
MARERPHPAGLLRRWTGPWARADTLRDGVLFKTLQVVRFFDKERNVLVYVAYSDWVIEGSPKNSISSVPIMSWPEP